MIWDGRLLVHAHAMELPFGGATLVARWRASEEERKAALEPFRAKRIVEEVYHEPGRGRYDLIDAWEALKGGRPHDAYRIESSYFIEHVLDAVAEGKLLVVPGWHGFHGYAGAPRPKADTRSPERRVADEVMGRRLGKELSFEGSSYVILPAVAWPELRESPGCSLEVVRREVAQATISRMAARATSADEKEKLEQAATMLADTSAPRVKGGLFLLQRRVVRTFSFDEPEPAIAPTMFKRLLEEGSKRPELHLRLIDATTEKPVSGVALTIHLPDGSAERATTNGGGVIHLQDVEPGSFEVTSVVDGAEPATGARSSRDGVVDADDMSAGRFFGLKYTECVEFVGIGEEGADEEAPPASGATCRTAESPKAIVKLTRRKVRNGETPESVAEDAGLKWGDLAYFNFGTKDAKEVNQWLAEKVGCTKKSEDASSYVFDDSDSPGILLVPKLWRHYGLAPSRRYVIRVMPVVISNPCEKRRCLVVDDLGQPRSGLKFSVAVDGPVLATMGTTDARGAAEFEVWPNSQRATLTLEAGGESEQCELLLRPLDPVQDIAGAQTRLNHLGFSCGAADGILGIRTRTALQRFQEANGLTRGGEIDAATAEALASGHGA